MKKILVLIVIMLGLAVIKPARAAPIDDLTNAIGSDDIRAVKTIISANKSLLSAIDDVRGATPLMWAMKYRNIVIADLLIKNGADVNQPGRDGLTPLILISMPQAKRNFPGEEIEGIEFLIQNGANVNQGGKDGKTALMVASTDGEVEIVESLLRHGAYVNQGDKSGWTALMAASGTGQINAVELLIKNGAAVNQVDKELGVTALMLASFQAQIYVAELLIKNGAAVNQATFDGVTRALTIAKESKVADKTKKSQMVALLQKYGAK